MIGFSIVGIIVFIVIVLTLFLNFNPQFGKSTTKKQKELYAKSGNFQNGKFTNEHSSPMDVNYWKIFKELTKPSSGYSPRQGKLEWHPYE